MNYKIDYFARENRLNKKLSNLIVKLVSWDCDEYILKLCNLIVVMIPNRFASLWQTVVLWRKFYRANHSAYYYANSFKHYFCPCQTYTRRTITD